MLRKTVLAAALALAAVPALADGFALTSPDVAEGKPVPEAHVLAGFGCTGGNASPGLAWSGAPSGTKSFALTVYDPDAPTGSGWWHWVVFNLPADTKGLARGVRQLPTGAVQGRTDFGAPGYGGPCPPPGPAHRYVFTIHALDVATLPLDEQASAAMVGFMVNAHSLGRASLTPTYGR